MGDKCIVIFCFVWFWLRWVFIAARGLSLVAASGGYSSLQCVGFSLRQLLLLWSMGSRRMGFSSCGTWAQQLWHTGLVAPMHVESSQTRDGTHVPCIGRQILNHCATREVPKQILEYTFFFLPLFSTQMLSYSTSCTSHLIKPEDYFIPIYKGAPFFFNAATLYRSPIIYLTSPLLMDI